jgi:hypothetical protein
VPAYPPFRWQIDNQRLFPVVCAKSGKWFHPGKNCFVDREGRNIGEKSAMISVECWLKTEANGRTEGAFSLARRSERRGSTQSGEFLTFLC